MATYPVSAVTESTGIAGQSRNSFTNRFKLDFMKSWDDHVHTGTVVASHIAKKKGTMGGFESIGEVVTSLPQSAGIAKFEGFNLPTPRVGESINPKLHARDIYSRLRWTGQVERAARGGDKYAWKQPRQKDIKDADTQFRLNFARMLYLGSYQPMATVASFNDGTNVATLYSRNARRSSSDDLWKFGSHYLRVNMAVDYILAQGAAVQLTDTPTVALATTNGAECYITAIDNSDLSAPTITLSGHDEANDPADEAIIIPFHSRRGGALNTDLGASDITQYAGVNGLMQIATDATIYSYLYDLARSSNPTLNGLRNRDAGGAPRSFQEDLITLAVDNIADNGTGDEPTMLLCHRAVRREYLKENKGDRRFKEIQTEKGFGQLVFHAGDALLPVVTDRDCPPGVMFVLKESDYGWLSQSELGPIDESSERFVADVDAREVILHKSGNIVCEAPFNSGTIEDIAFDVTDVTV